MQPNVQTDLSEKMNYNTDVFPLYAHRHKIADFDFRVLQHWHPDVEYLLVETGRIQVFVNDNILTLHAGEGIFINSNRMNYSFSHTEATFIAVIMDLRRFLDATPATQQLFIEKFGHESTDYLLLSPNIDWQKKTLQLITQLHTASETAPILTRLQLIMKINAEISQHLISTHHHSDHRLQNDLWEMTHFIQNHFSADITVLDIANAAHVSRSQCFTLFKKYLNTTPNQYLTTYRLSKASDMLRDTSLNILTIASLSGFTSSSYFTRIFQRYFGMSPKNYRKNQ
ncbi:MAG TPA: AraC family transcriptional regulator [Lactobacillaceae bacterium]|jgi:AraC-like DNA-binding protein